LADIGFAKLATGVGAVAGGCCHDKAFQFRITPHPSRRLATDGAQIDTDIFIGDPFVGHEIV
jgi:hypothetical protein